MGITYRDSGVDTDLGNMASKILYEAAKESWRNRKGRFGEVIEAFGDFSGLRAVHVGGLPKDTVMNLGFDGVGSKIDIAERIAMHHTVALDLFAMVCDDAAARGAEPVLIGTILDVKSLGRRDDDYLGFIRQLAQGYVKAAEEANVCVVNGELAELGARVSGYGPFNYNWGAGLLWFARESRLISGYGVKAGDKIVALREEGFRSNGLSLARKIFSDAYGDEWHLINGVDGNLGERMLVPSRIYCKAVTEMIGGIYGEPEAAISAIAHITGGGIPEKLGRALKPSGLGAELYDLFPPGDIVRECQRLGDVTDEEAYSTWNMGQGMLIATRQPDKVIAVLNRYGIEARIAGEVTRQKGIRIRSKGIDDKTIIF